MASGYYDITNKTLGKGHYGVVKLGRHCLTGEPVAIKIIEKSRLNNDSLNQLGTEIRILFRLSEYEHPNILKLYQTIDTEDKLFLVTEYCGPHACDLHDYLLRKHSRDGLGEKEAQVFFVQICSAISYCHSMGIVHRDLKPENILVTDYRHMHTNPKDRGSMHEIQYPLLKLIDFGFANQWYPDEKMRTSCGTLAYSAPELLLGEPYDGTKVDVWGLGLMLYILLYGGNPFMQINDNETLTKILDCEFATPKRNNVDCDAVELLRSLIKRNPDTRLSIDAILRHKWFSDVPKQLELMLKYKNVKVSEQHHHQSPCSKQLPNKLAPVVSPTLPSISESGPLKNLNRSLDDDDQLKTKSTAQTATATATTTTTSIAIDTSETAPSPGYNRTRSLSITRTHTKPIQQQSLPQTRSSINLGRLLSQQHHHHQQHSAIIISPLPRGGPNAVASPRGPPMYRPTSPDVGGSGALSEEERQLHERVMQDMFRLTKLIDSKSSIEASLKNARFAHRLFNQNSIKPAQFGKRKVSTGLVRSLLVHATPKQQAPPLTAQLQASEQSVSASKSDNNNKQLGPLATSSKLSNDDYIYATYQLTRDRILRVKQEQLVRRPVGEPLDKVETSSGGLSRTRGETQTHLGQSEEDDTSRLRMGGQAELCKDGSQSGASGGLDRAAAKENEVVASATTAATTTVISASGVSRFQQHHQKQHQQHQHQRKQLQPQHKMRDKFTSFFRSGSTSPSGSFNTSHDSSSQHSGAPGEQATCPSPIMHDVHHHEAFSDHNNETSGSTGRYFGTKADSLENAMAYALPLARKCSLVSEESGAGCSNDLSDH